MPDNFNLDNYKIIIQNFSLKGNTLYWCNKPIASKDDLDSVLPGTEYFVGGPTVSVSDGGTGAKQLSGLIKGNGTDPFTEAELGSDYINADSTDLLKNKTIDTLDHNTIQNLTLSNFAAGVVSDTLFISSLDNTAMDPSTAVNDDEAKNKIVTQRALFEYLNYQQQQTALGSSLKTPVKVATTKDISLDSIKPLMSIDGVVLSLGDRVLVKDQTFGTQNGIYVVTANKLERAADAGTGVYIAKSQVFVSSGITNKGTTWFCPERTVIDNVTNITWVKISSYPVYTASDGIRINESNEISVDSDLVYYRGMRNPVETRYGGTGTTEYTENKLIVTKKNEDGDIVLESLHAGRNNSVLLSSTTDAPVWSEIAYPKNLEDKALLYVDDQKIQGLPYDVGLLYIDNTLTPQYLSTLPENFTINNKKIYFEGGQVIPISGGGTGRESISKDAMIYGANNSTFSEILTTPFGRNLLSTIDVDDLKLKMNLGLGASLNIGTTAGTIAEGNHTHDNYVTRDGTQYFSSTISGVNPISADHLATKGYVDAVARGQQWQSPVLSIITSIPNTLHYKDRYLISANATGALSDKKNYIATVNRSGQIEYEEPQETYALKVVDTGKGYIYNGEEWVLYSTNDPHNTLSQLQGGEDNEYYHLSHKIYVELTGKGLSNSHLHLHNDTLGLQGGDGKDYYHLTASEYSQISNSNFKFHDKLFNLYGGDADLGQYYHLDYNQYNQLVGKQTNTIHYHSHDLLKNINGSSEAYHLSKSIYEGLTGNNGTKNINYHTHTHNRQTDIQGGELDQYYHLNKEYYDIVMDIKNRIKKNHNDLDGIQGGDFDEFGNAENYHLSASEYGKLTQGRDAQSLHTHQEYIKNDGSVPFLASPSCPDPSKMTDIATKGYVDARVDYGIHWLPKVSTKTNVPPTYTYSVNVGTRYLITAPAKNEWTGYEDSIAEWTGSSWSITEVEKDIYEYVLDENGEKTTEIATDYYGNKKYERRSDRYAVFVEDTETQIVWNGNEWVEFAVKNDHSSLYNLEGGENGRYFHLSPTEYTKLTQGYPCDLHYHPDIFEKAEGTLGIAKGGTGLNVVPKNTFLYAAGLNRFEARDMSEYASRLMNNESASGFRSMLGLNDMATQSPADVHIISGVIEELKTPLGILNGGTGLHGIPSNSIAYVGDNATPMTTPITESGIAVLSKNRDDLISYLGINEAKNVATEVPGGRSKLFYLIAFGI